MEITSAASVPLQGTLWDKNPQQDAYGSHGSGRHLSWHPGGVLGQDQVRKGCFLPPYLGEAHSPLTRLPAFSTNQGPFSPAGVF